MPPLPRKKELNAADQLMILHAAATEELGTLWLNEGLDGQVDDGCREWGRSEVPAYSVDALAKQYGKPKVVLLFIRADVCSSNSLICFAVPPSGRLSGIVIDTFFQPLEYTI
jgi:hypothetical protein